MTKEVTASQYKYLWDESLIQELFLYLKKESWWDLLIIASMSSILLGYLMYLGYLLLAAGAWILIAIIYKQNKIFK